MLHDNSNMTGSPARPARPALASFLIAFSLSHAAVAQPSRFSFTGSLNVPRTNHTATRLTNGKVLIVGGTNGNNVLTSSELYDPDRGNFRLSGRLGTAREGFAAALLNTGKVLIVGGWSRTTLRYLASAELYDPATGTFTATGSLNIARGYHSATPLANGMVLILGGSDNTFRSQRTAELYNPVTATFTATGQLVTARSNHTATLLQDAKVLVAGGSDGSPVPLTSAEVYDPTTGTFTGVGNLNVGSSIHTATLLNDGHVLIAGGFSSPMPMARAELYDPVTMTFAATGSLTTGRYSATGTVLNDGNVLIAGGNGDGVTVGAAEIYDPTTGVFSPGGSLNLARSLHTATLLADGTVLLAAGGGSVGPSPTAEIYQSSDVPPPPGSLQITPGNVTMLVGETRQFAAIDSLGHPRSDAIWTVSDPTLVTLTAESAPFLTAVAAGQLTLTATAQGVSAQTQVTISSSSFVPGTGRWSTPAVPGFSTVQLVQAVPTLTNPGPDFFSLSSDGTYTLVQGLTNDGQQVWQNWLPIVNKASVPDGFGGLIVTIYNTCDFNNPMGIAALDGATGQPRWQVIGQSTCTVDRPQLAIRQDGSVVVAAVGNTSGFPELMFLNGQTGQLLSAPQIPQSSYVQSDGRTVMGYSPIGPPMVDSDGMTYVTYEVRQVAYPPRITSAVLWLLKIAPDGTATTRQLSSTTNDENLFPGPIIPDGNAGVVATWIIVPSHPPASPNPFQAAHVSGSVTTYALPIPPQELLFEPSGLPINPLLVLGETGRVFASYRSDLVAFDLNSGAVSWRYSAAPQAVAVMASAAGNGLVAKRTDPSGSDNVIRFDSAGIPTSDPWSAFGIQHYDEEAWLGSATRGGPTSLLFATSFQFSDSAYFRLDQGGTRRAVQKIAVDAYSRTYPDPPLNHQVTIRNMLDQIRMGLASDSFCTSWLGGITYVSEYISGLLTSNRIGHGTFHVGTSQGGVIPEIVAFVGGPGQFVSGVPPDSLITVNDASGFFQPSTVVGACSPSLPCRPGVDPPYTGGTPQAQGSTLIHELGHLIVLEFERDLGNNRAGHRNDQKVDNFCRTLIQGLHP